MMWFMGSLEKQVPPLQLLQSQHFKHIKRGHYFFCDLKNDQKHVEMAARIRATWKEDNKWDERSLSEMHVSIKDLFDFEMARKARKSKRSEQQRWETIYWKLKRGNLGYSEKRNNSNNSLPARPFFARQRSSEMGI
eukprot:6890870-Ditylum_brightwellii.AAC.1